MRIWDELWIAIVVKAELEVLDLLNFAEFCQNAYFSSKPTQPG
jgi:hypothetical protein